MTQLLWSWSCQPILVHELSDPDCVDIDIGAPRRTAAAMLWIQVVVRPDLRQLVAHFEGAGHSLRSTTDKCDWEGHRLVKGQG